MKARTSQQRASWAKLSARHRKILLSHRRDDLEQTERFYQGVMKDLEMRFGDRQWDATLAVLAEGESDGSEDEGLEGQPGDGCFTLHQVGIELGVGRDRARQIQEGALRKLRANDTVFHLLREYYDGTIPPAWLREALKKNPL